MKYIDKTKIENINRGSMEKLCRKTQKTLMNEPCLKNNGKRLNSLKCKIMKLAY